MRDVIRVPPLVKHCHRYDASDLAPRLSRFPNRRNDLPQIPLRPVFYSFAGRRFPPPPAFCYQFAKFVKRLRCSIAVRETGHPARRRFGLRFSVARHSPRHSHGSLLLIFFSKKYFAMLVLSHTMIRTGGVFSWASDACSMYSKRSFHWLARVKSAPSASR